MKSCSHIAPPVARVPCGRNGLHTLSGGATVFIYRAVFPNGKCYVGQTVDCARRWKKHIWDAKAGRSVNLYLQNALRKYGDSVVWEVIAEVPAMWANDEEIRQIAAHNSIVPNGYNIVRGGKNKDCPAETRAKISASVRAAKKVKPDNKTKEWRENLSKSLRAFNAGLTKEERSASRSGGCRTAEQRAKISASLREYNAGKSWAERSLLRRGTGKF